MSRAAHVRLMAGYNQWMNSRLLEAAGRLPAAELAAPKGAFFGSILGTLNHLVVGDTIWLKRFCAHPAGYPALAPIRGLSPPASLDDTPFDDFEALKAHRMMLDGVICGWAESITEPDLDLNLAYANMKGIPARRNFFSLLMHFFNHQTHHRGQATTLLSQGGVDVGITDLLAVIADVPAA